MIYYDMPDSMKKVITPLTDDLLIIDSEDNEITIYQDFVEKHKIGIPSGVMIKSKSKIYPCAVPDVGCGFRVVKFEGVSKEDFLKNEQLINKINQFLNGKTEKDLIKGKQITVESMLRQGYYATAHIFSEERSQRYENKGVFHIDTNHKHKKEIFPAEKPTSLFNKYQGHFLEFLEPINNKTESVYLLIHTGSFILAENLKSYYYPLLAKLSYTNKWSNEQEVLSGKFGILKNCDIVTEYYNDIKLIMNFSIAYRDLIEYCLEEIIKNELGKEIHSVVLSDYNHTKLDIAQEYVIHQRGIQFLNQSKDTQYVISGNYGIGSLLFMTSKDQFFSHGVQIDINLCPEYLPESRKLFSKELYMNNEALKMLKQSSLAQIAYDFYLSKNTIFVDYLIPFYSFKGEK